jgi:GNAT superfamily N-acetyltransferase
MTGMAKTIETTVTFLELTKPPALRVQRPTNLKLMLMRAEAPPVGFYRYLYDAVGRDFHWVDRKKLSDAALRAIVHDPGVEVWVLYARGAPAGYFEIDARDKSDVELAYFALTTEFQGIGLGKWFLSEAIAAGFAHNPARLRVETCTLDGPAALPLYQKLGFVPVAREDKVMELLE